MNFATQDFLVFYAVVFACYWLVRHQRARKVLLLLASYYFYMCWNPKLVVLIWASTLLDFGMGQVLARTDRRGLRKAALIASCVGNLGLLGIFKYAGFFAESFAIMANRLGFHMSPVELKIVLPVGISFYTFQTMSYTIDLYRRRIPACHSPLDFALFVAFFPQLVAGPILRASHFLPQLQGERRWSWQRFRCGMWRFVRGLAKKVIIADSLALVVVDPMFHTPEKYGFLGSWTGVICFAVQIYCDFSGYSDVAIGTAAMLGYHVPENFDHPYLARGLRDFWRRWHISLSTWLRDYLYIPLGGNRRGRRRTLINLMLTMLLGGLWHGAAWTFIAWGAYHGGLLATERKLQERGVKPDRLAFPSIVITCFLVCFGWALFRADSFGDARTVVAGMLGLRGLGGLDGLRVAALWLVAVVFVTHALAFVKERWGYDWQRPLIVRAALATGCAVGIPAFWYMAQPFIYFQF